MGQVSNIKIMSDRTIVAQATAPGSAGVAVVRVSGTKVDSIITNLGLKLKPRYASFGALNSKDGEIIDSGVWLYFKAPHSFTGEDILEFQGHGNQFLISEVIDRFVELGCVIAEPGEFSKRAFLNNKIDLVQAEAVADLVSANSKQAAKMAIASLFGRFSDKLSEMVDGVVACRVQLEAVLDFPEEDIDTVAKAALEESLAGLIESIASVLKLAEQGAMLQSGVEVALIGPPNVGKSSLFNHMLGRNEAIVTQIAGTTRDVIKQDCKVGSLTITLQDTAGIHDVNDEVEQEGIRRAIELVDKSNLILLVLDDRYKDQGHDDFIKQNLSINNKPIVYIWNKDDLMPDNNFPGVRLSAKNKTGFELLFKEIEVAIQDFLGGEEHSFIARSRHVCALKAALTHCNDALVAIKNSDWELSAEDCRLAQNELNSITGEFSNEDLLGRIFSTFCIGK